MVEPVRVAIADDSALIYSDDYRDGWVKGFRQIGCEVSVFDIGKLRNSASRYSRYRTKQLYGLPKVVGGNILNWKPHLLWCHHGRAASDPRLIEMMRSAGVHTAVYLCDEPYEVGETANYSRLFDSVFSMDLHTLPIHRVGRKNDRVFYLPPAADPERFGYRPYFDPANRLIRKHSAFFLGNADLIPRRRWLELLEKTTNDVDIRYFPHRQPRGRPVAKGHPQWIGMEQYHSLYANCVVGLNVHRSPVITQECFTKRVKHRGAPVPPGIHLCHEMPSQEGTGFWNDCNAPASHVNPRFFEMAACGTCVVSDSHRSELARMFPMAPRAEDENHFVELVQYYMQHIDQAEEIGRACCSLVLKRHTYQHRAAEVLIRLGFKESVVGNLPSSLGEPQDWLSPQDFNAREVRLSLEQTGHLGRWSPRYGMSLIQPSGNPSEAWSIDAPNPW